MRGTKFLAKLRSSEPAVIIRGVFVLQFTHVLRERLFCFGVAPELQQEMLDGLGVRYRAAIVGESSLRARIAGEADQARFVNVAGDLRSGTGLRLRRDGNSGNKCQGKCSELNGAKYGMHKAPRHAMAQY